MDLFQITNGNIIVRNICSRSLYQHLEVASQLPVGLLSPYFELIEEQHACNQASSAGKPEQAQVRQIRYQWSCKQNF